MNTVCNMRLASFSLVLALIPAAAGGCAMTEADPESSQAAEVGISPNLSAFVLTVDSPEGLPVTVTTSSGTDTCSSFPCNLAYVAGTSLSIFARRSKIVDCVTFDSWSGACSGQGDPCSLVINSNLSTTAQYRSILGCTPQ